jgi:hypothetical protein
MYKKCTYSLQEENARLIQRESVLVGQIEGMEKQMQKYVQVAIRYFDITA